MRPAEVVRRAEGYLLRHGVDSPRRTAEILMEEVLGTDRSGVYSRGEGLSTAEAREFGRALCLRCAGAPLQHITGRQRFRRMDLRVEPGVFVPRPETETVVEVALQLVRDVPEPVIVDVGTGTGAVALALKQERPDAAVHATDASGSAVRLALQNAGALALEVSVYGGDLLEPLPAELAGAVDLIVSNPPYVDPEDYASLPVEVLADPELSLVGGTEFHSRLAEEAPEWLRPGGALALEVGTGQGREVAVLLRARFRDVEVWPDLAGRDRTVSGRLRSVA